LDRIQRLFTLGVRRAARSLQIDQLRYLWSQQTAMFSATSGFYLSYSTACYMRPTQESMHHERTVCVIRPDHSFIGVVSASLLDQV
jgi:hypothetical protein